MERSNADRHGRTDWAAEPGRDGSARPWRRWAILVAFALSALAWQDASGNGELGPDDLWSVKLGTTVTDSSALHDGSLAANMFGATGGDEPDNAVFADAAGGFTHFVEWRTAAPVTVCRIDLFAYDNPGTGDRGYKEFRLYAKNPQSQVFEFVTSFTPGNPYPGNDGFVFGSSFAVLDFAAVSAQEFRAEFDQFSSCSETLGVRIAELRAFGPAPTTVESFFLPKLVRVKVNAADASKSTVVASGFFDTGPKVADFASPATLDVGGLHFNIPALLLQGSTYVFSGGGVSFKITPNKSGSSRAKFRMTFKGDVGGKVAPDGPLDLAFADATSTGRGSVTLAKGLYGLGRVRGALVKPNLYLARAKAGLKGSGKDSLSLVVGLATAGTTPTVASDLSVSFGDTFSATIPAGQFVKKGDVYTFAGDVNGITKVIVNYLRETITISGKGLDLGNFPQGPNIVLVGIGFGAETHAVRVRMGRTGASMRY